MDFGFLILDCVVAAPWTRAGDGSDGPSTFDARAVHDAASSLANPKSKIQNLKWQVLAPLVAAVAALAGCSPPQVAPQNYALTASLRTALSAQSAAWLDDNVNAIEARRTAGQMGDDEYAEFQAIVEMAKRGDWSAAERRAVRLQKAQRPTDAMQEAVAKRRVFEHEHDHASPTHGATGHAD